MIILYSECSSYFKTQESALPKNHDCQVTSRLSNEPPSKKPKLDIGIDSESVSDTEDETMSSQTSQTSGDDIHLNLSDDDNEADKLTGSIDCPECRKSMANLSQLYMHLRVCHDRSKWLHFRTKKVPGIQEYQCPKWPNSDLIPRLLEKFEKRENFMAILLSFKNDSCRRILNA